MPVAAGGRVIHALKSHKPALQIDGFELTEEFVDRARRLLRETGLYQGVRSPGRI